jgi:type II secretory pathway component PulF
MEKINSVPIVWISVALLATCFLLRGLIIQSIARIYSGFVILISALGFLFLSWNMMLYGWALLVIATGFVGFGIKFSEFIRDPKPTILPPKKEE